MANIDWAHDVSGSFQTGPSWVGQTVPGASDNAILDAAGGADYTATSSIDQAVNSIQLVSTATLSIVAGNFTATAGTGAGANAGTILIGDNTSLSVGGVLDNSGLISLVSGGDTTELFLTANTTLDGGGAVTLGDNANNAVLGDAAAVTLTNVNDTISGGGSLGDGQMTLVNDTGGVIDATGTNNALILDTTGETATNTGLLEATGVAGLTIDGTEVKNGTLGTILATAGSVVNLAGSDIVGGTLETEGTGVTETAANDRGSVIDGRASTVDNTGALDVTNNAYLTIEGTIDDTGAIGVDSVGNDTRLVIGANASLTGDGAVTLTDNSNNSVIGAAAATTLTNVDDTISGGGNLGDGQMTLVNDTGGVIDATGTSNALILDTAGEAATNTGLLEATGAAGLTILNTEVKNGALGTILAAAGSVVNLASADIVGGTLETEGTGVIETAANDQGSVIDGRASTVDNTGALDVTNNAYLTIEGAIDNTSVIGVDSVGNDTRLIIGAAATLEGGGAVTLTDNSNNSIIGAAAPTTLTNVDNTITGAGNLGDGQLTLVNDLSGVIDGTGTNNALILDTGSGTTTNAGLIEATGAAGMTIENVVDATTSGVITAATGSAVNLAGADIVGGTLETSGTGVIETAPNNRASLLDGTTSAIDNTGALDVTNNAYLTIEGTIRNGAKGVISVGSVGNDTELVVGAKNAVISGGAVTLSQNSANQISGTLSGVAPDQTVSKLTNEMVISGGGTIGANLLLVNDTTIDATGAVALVIAAGNSGVAGSNVVTNDDLLESTNPNALSAVGGLVLASVIANSSAGVIEATGAATNVDLQGATIEGGTLKTLNGGVIQTAANNRTSVIDGETSTVDNSGQLDVTTNAYLTVEGTIDNTGVIGVDSTGYDTRLVIGANTLLEGGGAVTLVDNVNNGVIGAAAASLLTNVNNTISGAGNLGDGQMTLVNDANGVVDATGANALVLNTNGETVKNVGLLEATGAGGLTIQGTEVNNLGTILAGAGSAVSLSGADIVGGIIETRVGGAIQTAVNDRASIIDGTTSAVDNEGALDITTNAWLTLEGTIDNTGVINLQSTGYDTRLIAGANNLVLTGKGAVTLTDNSNNSILGAAATTTLTNVNNTISGAGNLGDGQMVLINDAGGVIDATGTANALILDTGGATIRNAGLIEASGAAGLVIDGVVDEVASGEIMARAGSVVSLDSAEIIGGPLKAVGSGVIETATNSRGGLLDALTSPIEIIGQLDITTNAWLTVEGTIDDTDVINLQSTGYDTRLILGANTTLEGGGAVTLTDNGNNSILGATGATTLTNVNNTISGAGNLGDGQMTLVNEAGGVIDANGANAIILDTSGETVTNAGLIEATGAGGLTIQNTEVNNSTVGTIVVDTGSVVNLSAAEITGGTLKTLGSGVIETAANDRSSVLDGEASALEITGQIDVTTNAWLTVEGVIHDTGVIALQSTGYDTRLIAGANTTLVGGGHITLTDNANNSIIGAAAATRLINVNDTISGAGNLGDGQLTLFNDANGVIDASGTNNALIIDTGAVTVTNDGVIEATGAGGLEIANTEVNGAAVGKILIDAGSLMILSDAEIVGGTLTTTGSGVVETAANDRSCLINGMTSTVDLDATLDVTTNAWLKIEGTIDNTGVIAVQSNGYDTRLIMGANTTLTGDGAVTLTDNSNNSIIGAAATTTLTNGDTISGAGNLGDGQLTLINAAAGVIDASGTNNALIINTGSATITNAGLIEATGAGANIQSSLFNRGVLEVDGGNLTDTGAVTGGGSALIVAGTMDFESSFAENVTFNAVSGVLELAQSQSYSGAITSFSTHGNAGSDILDLDDIAFVSASEATFKGNSAGGVLTVTDGTHTASISLVGSYTRSTFVAASNGAGGTDITVNATTPIARAASYSVAVGQRLATTAATGVLSFDIDPNGLPLTAALATGGGPTHGTLRLNANGAFTYIPDAGFSGTDTFTYIASDAIASAAPTRITIHVESGSVIANPATYSDQAGHALITTAGTGVLANDSDANDLPLTAALAPGGGPSHGTLTLNSNGSFTYTPTLGFDGTDTFTYIASDSVASSAPTLVTIDVNASAPTTAPESYADGAGKTLTTTAATGVLAGDTDPNGLTLTAALASGGGPSHGTLTLGANGSFTYTPDLGFAGKDSFTYIASDGLASSAATKVTIDVTASPPTSAPETYDDGAGQTLATTAATGVLANDTDPNGLTLTAALATDGGPSHGTLTLNSNGSFTYTPTAGFAGKDTFTYIASDSLASGPATVVTIDVAASSVVSNPETYADQAGHALIATAATGVLANDSDANGLPLTAALAPGGGPSHGTLTLDSNGSFTYTPTLGFAGKDTFTYIASDSVASGSPTLVTIDVTASPPTSAPETYDDGAGQTLTTTAATGVLANDTDPNGLTLTAALAPDGGPGHGTLTLNANGSFTYTPTAGFTGKDSFTYIASDSLASGPATTVTIDVTTPTIVSNPETYGDQAGHGLTTTAATGVLADDSDPNGLPLTAALAPDGGPSHGSLTLNANGSFTYTPTLGFAGVDSFSYIASDSLGSGAATKVTIDVTASAPVTKPETYSAITNETLTVGAQDGVLANDTDPNGLTLTATLAPGGGPLYGTLTLNSNGSFTYILNAGFGGFSGVDTFSYIASDALVSSAPTQVTIDVSNGAVSIAGVRAAAPATSGAAHSASSSLATHQFVAAMATLGSAGGMIAQTASEGVALAHAFVSMPGLRSLV